MIIRKNKQQDVRSLQQKLAAVTVEYEKLTMEQKDRIMNLRNENKALQEKLQGYEDKHQAIANALTEAEKAADAILARAKAQAAIILKEAEKRRIRSEERAREYDTMLRDLAQRCEHILNDIERQLTPSPTNLELVTTG
ncbi:MAG: DivIVA domain-containing protein [Christensenellaceae bacterium]|nr:DivIVA domain-containing protein [Christensenellaceae bacterium]